MAKSLDKKRASSKKEDLKKPIKTGREVPKKVLARTVVNSSTNLQELANIITGETQLKKNKAKIAALKREAVEKQKDAIREAVNTGKVFLEPSEEYNPIRYWQMVVPLKKWCRISICINGKLLSGYNSPST